MKKIISIAVALMAMVSCTSNGYRIDGVISGDSQAIKNGKVYLFNNDKRDVIKDTTDIINGRFQFKGNVKTPEYFFIQVEGIDNGHITLFLENVRYNITAVDTALLKATITGGPTQDIFNQAKTEAEQLYQKYGMDAIIAEYRNPATTAERKDELNQIVEEYYKEDEASRNAILEQNPFSQFSFMDFRDNVADMPVDSASAILDVYKSKEEFKDNKFITYIDEILEINRKLAVGCASLDFTLNDPNGKPVTLSDIYKKNKVTMIDFWAGWCGPCRRFNPTLVKIYAQYHKKGFEVLGVSLDRERDLWLGAIKNDKLTWPQVSDLQYWNSEAAKLYNIRYIPQNVFVDQNGIIIGKKLNEEEIPSFLEEHLK